MTAKEYLGQAYRIDQRINSKLEQLQSLRYLATKASAVLTTDPISSTRNVHSMEDVIIKIADLKSEISADLCQLIDTKHEIVTVIKCVENNELQTLLELRYLCFKNWEQIAVEMHLDLRWIHRLHNRALNEIDKIRHY